MRLRDAAGSPHSLGGSRDRVSIRGRGRVRVSVREGDSCPMEQSQNIVAQTIL